MKLQFFSRDFVTRLQQSAGVNHKKYDSDMEWLESFAAGKKHVNDSRFVVDPPPKLIESDKPADDAENSKRVFVWLNQLTPAVAMELRLWAHLTHCVFKDYMRVRWPADSESLVQRRYLFEGHSFAALSRNGIARLWWAAHLTRDEKRTDRFELTDTLFLRQDIQVAVLERAMGKCRGVRVALLEYIRSNESWLSKEAFGKRIQVLAKELNLLGGAAMLDAIPNAELTSYLEKIGTRLRKKSNAPSAA